MGAEENDQTNCSFISGVIEGFYGTPWKLSQRTDLYKNLRKWGMNTYMYAPKDDPKHRRDWRKKYTKIEKRILKFLIDTAKSNNVEFVYSISPGNDVVFSSPADTKYLKKKFHKVYELGCRSFAVLFDDIDPELCLVDKAVFSSSGDAQASITNAIYNEFKDVKHFFFCPTEYCTRRAKPDLQTSEYLLLIGEKLHPAIQILWTGPKVVSKDITSGELIQLADVLKRKPVIWENLHANDYDRRRVFFGPFKGRSTDIYQHINGFLTNPNCEFECNFMAICMLGRWIKAAAMNNRENDYDCNFDFEAAIDEWLDEMKRPVSSESSLVVNSLAEKQIIEDILIESDKEGTASESEDNLDSQDVSENGANERNEQEKELKIISKEDIILLCHLYYLPYENGPQGDMLFNQLTWLKENVDCKTSQSQEKVELWYKQSTAVISLCKSINDLYEKLVNIPNQNISREIHPYIYDLKDISTRVLRYVEFLGSKERDSGKSFFPDDPEPYFSNGGILSTLERMLPSIHDKSNSFCNGTDVIVIRPYAIQEKEIFCKFCSKFSIPELKETCKGLQYDLLLDFYMQSSSTQAYVLTLGGIIKGFIAGMKYSKAFSKKVKDQWLLNVLKRYTSKECKNSDDIEKVFKKRLKLLDVFHENEMGCFTWLLGEDMQASVLENLLKVLSDDWPGERIGCIVDKDIIERYEETFEKIPLQHFKHDIKSQHQILYYYVC